MSDAALERAAANGGANLAAQMAAAMGGGSESSELASALKRSESFLAGLPGKDQGTYAATGGSLPRGKSGGDAPAMNLSGIFGAPAGEQAPTNEGMAFRGPAAEDDIWHSNTDRNLFQIVSGKYEAVHDRVVDSR